MDAASAPLHAVFKFVLNPKSCARAGELANLKRNGFLEGNASLLAGLAGMALSKLFSSGINIFSNSE